MGFYSVAALLGVTTSYSSHPFFIAGYYVFWIGAATTLFQRFFRERRKFVIHPSTFIVAFLGAGAVSYYLLYILPLFPPIHWAAAWTPPVELITASPWYFLPKSLEIALQQVLVAVMVLAFDMYKMPVKRIAKWSAALFGSIHLLLILNGSTVGYVIVFTAAAAAAGYLFPYLMLRVRNGYLYAYFLQWGFYAGVMILARLIFRL